MLIRILWKQSCNELIGKFIHFHPTNRAFIHPGGDGNAAGTAMRSAYMNEAECFQIEVAKGLFFGEELHEGYYIGGLFWFGVSNIDDYGLYMVIFISLLQDIVFI